MAEHIFSQKRHKRFNQRNLFGELTSFFSFQKVQKLWYQLHEKICQLLTIEHQIWDTEDKTYDSFRLCPAHVKLPTDNVIFFTACMHP